MSLINDDKIVTCTLVFYKWNNHVLNYGAKIKLYDGQIEDNPVIIINLFG